LYSAAQFQDIVGAVNTPPGAGMLEPNMADELVGAFDGAAAQRIATPAQAAVVHSLCNA